MQVTVGVPQRVRFDFGCFVRRLAFPVFDRGQDSVRTTDERFGTAGPDRQPLWSKLRYLPPQNRPPFQMQRSPSQGNFRPGNRSANLIDLQQFDRLPQAFPIHHDSFRLVENQMSVTNRSVDQLDVRPGFVPFDSGRQDLVPQPPEPLDRNRLSPVAKMDSLISRDRRYFFQNGQLPAGLVEHGRPLRLAVVLQPKLHLPPCFIQRHYRFEQLLLNDNQFVAPSFQS